MTYTAEELARAYQLGYQHHSQGRPPLTNEQVPQFVEAVRGAKR